MFLLLNNLFLQVVVYPLGGVFDYLLCVQIPILGLADDGLLVAFFYCPWNLSQSVL